MIAVDVIGIIAGIANIFGASLEALSIYVCYLTCNSLCFA